MDGYCERLLHLDEQTTRDIVPFNDDKWFSMCDECSLEAANIFCLQKQLRQNWCPSYKELLEVHLSHQWLMSPSLMAIIVLRTLKEIPLTYGDLLVQILKQLCSMSPRVNFVCDTYQQPSIKEVEHQRREYVITGPSQN